MSQTIRKNQKQIFKSVESPPILKNTTKKFSFLLANATFLLYYIFTV
nr:MAG TPA: hypothetical protein [Caudoviricetes sp.]